MRTTGTTGTTGTLSLRTHACCAILLLAFTLLPGCSAVRVVYNQADNILLWMAHDYFEFDPLQRHDFNTRLAPLLAWHRHEQLPEYSRFLDEMRRRAERPVTLDDALWLTEGAKARFRLMAAKGAPDAAELLASVTPDNIKALQRQFDKVNRKFTREYQLNGSAEDRRRARLDRTLKRIRDWSGPLTPAQEARISAVNDTIPYTDHLRQQDRQRRQKEFLALLNTRGNKAEFTRTLRTWLSDWEAGRPAEIQAALNDGYDRRIALYIEVQHSLSAQQRAHMQQQFKGYIEDLNALAAKALAENK